tara:strand:- start:72 stop:326 length:255 start_codon:yes stop_codon:yes gene_type:complete
MSEPKKEIIKTLNGNLIVTESKVKHQKSGDLLDYLSFSNGQDVCGVFMDKNTKKELSKFLNKKEPKNDNDNNNQGNDNGTSTES